MSYDVKIWSIKEPKYDEVLEKKSFVMSGDNGGQIYLACPMNLVKCDKGVLWNLLTDLDGIAWERNQGEGKGMYFEIRNSGEIISGGMGGAWFWAQYGFTMSFNPY